MRLRFLTATISLGIAVLVLFAGCFDGADNNGAIERHKKLAAELRDNKLYEAAVEEYVKILALSGVEDKTRANINYLIGRIYFENIKDYEQAAAFYVRARALDPNGSFISELSRNLIASLEKMGRRIDASRQLAAATDLDAQPVAKGEVVVARLGGDPIYRSEVESHIQNLPPEVQAQFESEKARIEYLHQYVGIEVLYRAAVREGYGDRPEIKRQERLMHKKLLVDAYVVEKVMPQVQIDTVDVRNYYLANKGQRYGDAPYDSVRAQVFLDYQTQKAEAAFTNYVADLARVEKIEFFDERMK